MTVAEIGKRVFPRVKSLAYDLRRKMDVGIGTVEEVRAGADFQAALDLLGVIHRDLPKQVMNEVYRAWQAENLDRVAVA